MSDDAPATFPDGTQPGNERLVGQRCDVWFTDLTGKLPIYVMRVGAIDGIEPDGRVRVRLPWGQVVVAAPGEVFTWE